MLLKKCYFARKRLATYLGHDIISSKGNEPDGAKIAVLSPYILPLKTAKRSNSSWVSLITTAVLFKLHMDSRTFTQAA